MIKEHRWILLVLYVVLILVFDRRVIVLPELTRKQQVVATEARKVSRSAQNEDYNGLDGPHQICRSLDVSSGTNQRPILPSIGTLWSNQTARITEALLHSPANEPYGARTDELQALIAQVMEALSLSRLRRSVRPATLSANDAKIKRIMNVLWNRYSDPNKNPPLQVLVFGGSPTVGSNCERNRHFGKHGSCAWPGHLQDFLNAYLGFDAINIVNYGMGGSSSHLARIMLQLRLFPKSMLPDGPDVVINSYAVNDFSYHAGEEVSSGLSFQAMFAAFLEAVNQITNCERDRPLTIFLDDFSINYLDKNLIQPVEDYRAEIAKHTSFHQVLTVSLIDVTSDFLYSGSKYEKLLIDWKGDKKHLTWGGHVAVVTIFAYNAMTLLLHACDSLSTMPVSALPKDEPSLLDAQFRPPLDSPDLSLVNVNTEWAQRHARCDKTQQSKTCPFAWIALAKEDEHQDIADVSDIMVSAKNWRYVNKWPPINHGLYGSRNGLATLKVADTTNIISTITIIYMKSYSEKWYNSTVQANVLLCGNETASVELSGFHKKNTSEYYTQTIEFDNAGTCGSVVLNLQMTGGNTFRIMGLSFC